MTRRSLVSLFAALSVLLAALVLPVSAWAGPATDTVKSKQTALFDLLAQPKSEKTDKAISALFDEMLDYQTLAESTLGGEWAALKPEQKAEFTELLKQLVRKAYEKNLRKTLSYDIEYLSEEAAGDKAFVVKTRAKHKTDSREEPIAIDFKMLDKGVDKGKPKWLVVDIVTEEVSLVESYRTQFVKIIKKDGFPALITKMKDKLAKGDV